MKEPNLSIVIPAYNATKTIKDCLDSILNSNYPIENIEILVIDNNSTDSLSDFIKDYKVHYILEKNQGRSYARNRGIKEATHDFIVFLDADVFISNNWLKIMSEIISKNNVGGAQAKVIPSSKIGLKSLNQYRYRSISLDTFQRFAILPIICFETPMINSAACIYKKQALQEAGGFDITLSRHEDIDLAKRVFYSGYNLALTLKTSVFVHYHGDSWSDYFIRAFQDGYTKVEYLRKWQKYQNIKSYFPQLQNYNIDTLQLDNKNLESPKKIFSKNNILKKIISRFTFITLRNSLSLVRSLGGIYATLFTRDFRHPFSIQKRNQSSKEGFKLSPTKQFIFFDYYSYVYDLKTSNISILSQLESEYIKSIYELSEDQTIPYMGMKFISHLNKTLGEKHSLFE